MTDTHITFESGNGKQLLLEGVHYDVNIEGLMVTTSIAQHYTNPYESNIEAVYTFPLAPDAVLLGIEITINDRVLKGTITEKSEAEAQYEEAVEEGDRAIMVEKRSDGIYTVNIANLLPSDKVSVNIKYTQMLEWRQDQIKWSLPTTIAPKYGTPSDLNLDAVTGPAVSLLAENLFGFTMSVKGVLADSDINAPSHKIAIDKADAEIKITLQNEKDFMNKDIVFTFKTQKAREQRGFALLGKDFDGYAAIASFYPSFDKALPKQPKSVTFVIDCSGSMMGVSIESARTALGKALNLLSEEDSFNIVKFGSTHESLFEKEVPATQKNLNIAKRTVRALDANMGGTNMEEALLSAYAGHTASKEKPGYLFLITDGEVYDHKGVTKAAKRSEMRHFIVGVGYATDDALLGKVAKETRGAYENIDPNEKMDDYILNLFKRIDMPKAQNIEVIWPQQPTIEHTPNMVFDGDTLYAYAMFDKKPEGEVTLTYRLEDGEERSSTVFLSETADEEVPSVAARMVIAQEIAALNARRPNDIWYGEEDESEEAKTIVQLSTKYQLFSELTNYILVDEVAEGEKPTDLPAMHRVESMMVEQASMAYEVRECSSRRVLRRENFLDVPGFMKLESNAEKGVLFHDVIESSSVPIDTHMIEEIWRAIPETDYAMYLMMLDVWFSQHKRLPRKKEELLRAGFDGAVVALFDDRSFRKQMKLLAVKLYMEVGGNALSEAFEAYLETLAQKLTPSRFAKKIANWAKQLF